MLTSDKTKDVPGVEEQRRPLPNDIARCPGERDGEACPDRDTCRRYLDRDRASSRWVNHANFYKPGNLFGCMDKIEVVKPDEKEKRK